MKRDETFTKRVGRVVLVRRVLLVSLSSLSMVVVAGGGAALAESTKGSSTASVSASAGLTYTVRPGDGLSIIASRVKVTLSDLLVVNGFKKSSVILPGQVIALPDYAIQVSTNTSTSTSSSTSAAGSASAGLTYTVRPGDGLSIIASRVKVTLSDLLAVNGFKKSSVIVPGQVIKLPDYAAQSSIASGAVSGTSPNASTVAVSSGAAGAVEFAKAQLGKPYQFYTAGPATYDCSGLTKAAYASVGVSLPHQSLAQSKLGTAVDWRIEQIRPGDLIFTFSTRSPDQISHVGIAISSTQWIEAPYTGGTVRIAAIPSADRIQAVRRMVG